MQTDQLRKHLQLFTEGTPVPDNDLPDAAPAPAPAPAPAAGTDMASRLRAAVPYDGDNPELKNVKMVPLTAQEERKFKDIFNKMDAILLKYKDIKKKPFESVDFESMTESEQRQYLMQHLHLLNEADQMVVLRAIMSEGWKMDAAKAVGKWGLNAGEKAVGTIWNAGEKAVGWLANTGKQAVGGLWKSPVVQLPLIAGIARWAWNNWDELFPPNPAIDRMLSPEDNAEWYRLGDEAKAALPDLPDGYIYAYSTDLTEQMNSLKVRWEKLKDAAEERRRAEKAGPTKSEPGIIDQASGAASDAYDKVRGMFNK